MTRRPISILFLCTQNSARSQIAEALLAHCGCEDLHGSSAGTEPAERVNPLAVEVLGEMGIDWSGARATDVAEVAGGRWDVVVTVCDAARESCPVLPGAGHQVHWGLPDPAAVEGTEGERREAFRETAEELKRRIQGLCEHFAERPNGPPDASRVAGRMADGRGGTTGPRPPLAP